MKNYQIWFQLILKRLLKNPIFVLTLLLIPVMVLGIRFSAGAGSSMLKVAIYVPKGDSKCLEQQLARRLIESSQKAVTFYMTGSEKDLRLDVAESRAACGYILPEDLDASLREFPVSGKPSLKAVRQKDEFRTKIIDELVFSSIYDRMSYDILDEFIHKKTGKNLSPEQNKNFQKYQKSQIFIEYQYADGSANQILQRGQNPLVLPLRGMTAVLLLLSGMTGTLFWYHDKNNKLFVRLAKRERYPIRLLYVAAPVLLAGLCGLAAIFLTGISSAPASELLAMFLYLLDIIVFCSFLQLLLPRKEWIFAAIPVFAAGSLIVSPVFTDLTLLFPSLKYARLFTPVSWYLEGMHSNSGRLLMLVPVFVLPVLEILLRRVYLWFHVNEDVL